MSTDDDVRAIALALDGVAEKDSEGFDFRVDGRGFVWSYPERRPGQRRVLRTDIAVLDTGGVELVSTTRFARADPSPDRSTSSIPQAHFVRAARRSSRERSSSDAWSMRRSG